MMDIYTSEWNKETVMVHATRLLHITQELAVDAVTKYTKKQYARLGFGSSSLMNMNEEDELALVQEAYTIAWKYLNLTLEYTPIARTTLKLHTNHGALGNFIGTLGQDNNVLVGDNQGIYVCSSSGSRMARWYPPRTSLTSPNPNSTTAYTGRVLTGIRTSTIQTGWPTDLDAMSDVERMSQETFSIRLPLHSDYWWLTWYPKQQSMMIHKSESATHCYHPSEVTWSYRVAPSSYRQFVAHVKDWQPNNTAQAYTVDFQTHYPVERHQTDYAYEVRNDRGDFEWVEVKGTLPVYKCPPMLLKYFQDSFPHVQFEGDSSLEENNKYSELLNSIQDPRDVSGYVVWESAVNRTTMWYLQAELYAIPLSEFFPVRSNTFYKRAHKFPKPRPHSSGQGLESAANSPTWVYLAEDHPSIHRAYSTPPPTLYIGETKYTLYALINPARNASGLVMYPEFSSFMLTGVTNKFDDRLDFHLDSISMLGVRYTPEGEAYAICVVESFSARSWTHPHGDYAAVYPRNAQVINQEVSGIDLSLLSNLIKYEAVPSRELIAPTLDIPSYRFYVQLDGRPHPSGTGVTSGKDLVIPQLLKPDEPVGLTYAHFRAYMQESAQYQYMLNTPTGNSGFYKPELPADTHTFPSTSEAFINGS